MANETCPRCGMTKNQWSGNNGDGVQQAGQRYCCAGCANDTGCICSSR